MIESLEFFGSGYVWMLLVVGTLWGMFVGALPGITSLVAMVLILPLTFYMSIEHAIILFVSVYTGGIAGGTIPAILINIPGTGGNMVTTFDGYPMCQK